MISSKVLIAAIAVITGIGSIANAGFYDDLPYLYYTGDGCRRHPDNDNPCSSGSCPGGTQAGTCPESDSSKVGMKGAIDMGDPIDVMGLSVYRNEVDFSIDISLGRKLELNRKYASAFGQSLVNPYHPVFGDYWHTWIQSCIRRTTDSSLEFTDVDGNVIIMTLASTVDPDGGGPIPPTLTYTSGLDQGRLLKVVATNMANATSTTKYTLTRPDQSVWTYQHATSGFDGRLEKVDYDPNTTASECLWITYKTIRTVSSVPVIVPATVQPWDPTGTPGSGNEDRYLDLEYCYEVSSGSSTPDRVAAVRLKKYNSPSFAQDLTFYTYYSTITEQPLMSVMWSTDTNDYSRVYEYGDINLTTGSGTVASGSGDLNYISDPARLSRTSYTLYDPSTTSVETFPISGTNWRNDFPKRSVTFKAGPSSVDFRVNGTIIVPDDDTRFIIDGYVQDDPSTLPNYAAALATARTGVDAITYNGTYDDEMGRYMPVYGSSSRLIVGQDRYNPSAPSTPIPLQRTTLSTSSDVLLKGRPTQTEKWIDSSTSVIAIYAYDSTYPHKLSQVDNEEGEITQYEYWGYDLSNLHRWSRLKKIAHAWGDTTFDYKTTGELKSITSPDGLTELTWDNFGNVLTTKTWDGTNSNTQNVVTKTYDSTFNVVKTVTSTHMGTWTYTYTHELSTSDPQYFSLPRLHQVTGPNSLTTTYTYNSAGDITNVEDEDGNDTAYTYDTRRRLIKVTNAKAEETEMGYDLWDRLVSYEDGRGKTTTYTYDVFGRLKTETLPNTGTSAITEYTYGADSSCTSCGGTGQVETFEKPDGTTIGYEYDRTGRVTEVDYSAIGGGPELTYNYDFASRVTSVTDTRLPFTNKTYTYDRDIGATGFLTKITHPEGYTQEFFYNADKLEAYRDVDGSLIEYTYDAMGRISALADQFGSTTSWTYATTSDTSFPVNGIKQVTFGNGVTQNFTFDNMGRMTGLQYKKSDGTTNIENLAFTYIENNLIQKIVRTSASNANPFKMIYDYDELMRVTKEAGRLNSATDVSTPLWSREYAFDAAWNRSSYKYNTTTSNSTYNDRNELQSVGSYDGVGNVTTGATSYASDQNGNMDYRRWDNGYLQWDYDWTVDNKIKQVVYKDFVSGYSGSTTSTYTVDITNDYSHHKIMEKGSSSSSTARKRYFFNGLTEEVTKTATINSDDAFAFQVEDAGNVTTGWSGSILSSAYDSARRSNVLSVTTGGGGSSTKTFSSAYTEDVVTFWLKVPSSTTTDFDITLGITTSGGSRTVKLGVANTLGFDDYDTGTGIFTIPLTTRTNVASWKRFELNLAGLIDFNTVETLTSINSISIPQVPFSFDDLMFTNCTTLETNVVGPGAIGQILRNRLAGTDRWFLYDQVGSVIGRTNGSQTLSASWQDSYGNALTAPSGTAWTGVRASTSTAAGWHHNTKAYSVDLGYVQMGQRAYLPELGMFNSQAPYRQMVEHPFSFSDQSPLTRVDPDGRAYSIWGQTMRTNPKINNCPPVSPRLTDPTRGACYRFTNMGELWRSNDHYTGTNKLPYCSEGASSSHPGATECFRQVVPLGSKIISGSQCCYDKSGKLITTGAAAGTFDWVAPSIDANKGDCTMNPLALDRVKGHVLLDVIPWRTGGN